MPVREISTASTVANVGDRPHLEAELQQAFLDGPLRGLLFPEQVFSAGYSSLNSSRAVNVVSGKSENSPSTPSS